MGDILFLSIPDVTVTMSLSEKFQHTSPVKFPTLCTFRIFHISKIDRMMPFCNLFMEKPWYYFCGY